ncbi:curli production assembly protein CsgG [Thalassotalea litorea]|uniref:Curli production assembly/transport component CsgG n=1 Tax=Thalassotalea litorea TaxID=2020715 RepID=A0A5R9IJ41_9GAMM|nr:CsgG/HfaB family protein [Thalassotalea litorea]TLU64609.1 curli production assembly protein CsgG [Thalassotalea litorea]
MNLKMLSVVASILAISACTSATKEVVNQPIKTTPSISKTIAEAPDKSLKRVVAISRFTDETKRGNSFLVDQNNDRIGKQASDILSARLTDSGKFIMLERSDINAVYQENMVDDEQSSITAADYLIIGSVSEYGRSNVSDVGIFSRNNKQKAFVTVNVRLVNTKTSQVVFSEEASGEAITEANKVLGVGDSAGYDSSLDDKALSAAVSKLVSDIMENLLDAPWQAYLLSQENDGFFMSGGESQGIKKKDKFAVISKGKLIKNPQTGMMVEIPGKEVAQIEVVDFIGDGLSSLSFTQLVSGEIDATKLNEYVVREL